MTIAEKYILQGRNEGRTEGELNNSRQVLVRLLSKKFGLTDEERNLIESCDDLDRLAAALDRILDAQSKDEILARPKE